MIALAQTTTELQPQVLAALIAAAIAALSSLATLFAQHRTRKQLDRHRKEDQAALQRSRSAEFYRQQLDELYGEMLILRRTSRRLWDRLRAGEDPFRLIDEIETIKSEPSEKRRRIVGQILAINERLAALIESKASLLTELPPPDTFLQFLDHQRALANLWDLGKNADGSEPSFPRDLDGDIESAIGAIDANLREVQEKTPNLA